MRFRFQRASFGSFFLFADVIVLYHAIIWKGIHLGRRSLVARFRITSQQKATSRILFYYSYGFIPCPFCFSRFFWLDHARISSLFQHLEQSIGLPATLSPGFASIIGEGQGKHRRAERTNTRVCVFSDTRTLSFSTDTTCILYFTLSYFWGDDCKVFLNYLIIFSIFSFSASSMMASLPSNVIWKDKKQKSSIKISLFLAGCVK
jgi:hypothetical protein